MDAPVPMQSEFNGSPRPPTGSLTIYFGYAPGVGKTYQMLEDARRLSRKGLDVVIGIVESKNRHDILALENEIEVIPKLPAVENLSISCEMNVGAILARHPQVCVVDELARSSATSRRAKRWAQVQTLRQAGISVLTTMNVENLASLADQIWQLTGKRVRETVPDWLFYDATDVILVDVTPRALMNRFERGVVAVEGQAPSDEIFALREAALDALRELAIRQTAQALEARQRTRTKLPVTHKERILVNVTAQPATAMLLRRARRVADFTNAECLAVCFCTDSEMAAISSVDRASLKRHLAFAQSLHFQTSTRQANDIPRVLAAFARQEGVTQIFIHANTEPDKPRLPGFSFANRLLQFASDLEITIVAKARHEQSSTLAYPEDEAAALMHSGFVCLSPQMCVDDAISEIRHRAAFIEMISYGYVVDDFRRLLGVVSLRELLAAGRSLQVREIMKPACFSVPENADRQEIAALSAKHRLVAIPVVNSAGSLQGIVNSMDVAAMTEEKASADIQKMAGMEALDGAYLDVTLRQMIRKRAGWLAILFVGEMLTATAMTFFADEISKAVILALFLPLIISSGGNSGSQATTLVIRAMALHQIRLRDWWRVVGREMVTGLALGVFLGIIGCARILIWQATRGAYGVHYLLLALTISCSLVGVVLFGTVAGSMLPFVLKRCGLDPASASAPFVATLVDVTGLIIYFTVAHTILKGSLL